MEGSKKKAPFVCLRVVGSPSTGTPGKRMRYPSLEFRDYEPGATQLCKPLLRCFRSCQQSTMYMVRIHAFVLSGIRNLEEGEELLLALCLVLSRVLE